MGKFTTGHAVSEETKNKIRKSRTKDYSETIALYESGMRIIDIAAFYGMKPCSLNHAFIRRGVIKRSRSGENASGWNGGERINVAGYRLIYKPDHPRANKKLHCVLEHILVAEKALGKYLPLGAVVHHFDENTLNNSNDNLVICQDTKYHSLLHVRTRAYKACGNADWRKCKYCKQYDDPGNLYISPNGVDVCHRKCSDDLKRKRKLERRFNETPASQGENKPLMAPRTDEINPLPPEH